MTNFLSSVQQQTLKRLDNFFQLQAKTGKRKTFLFKKKHLGNIPI